MIALLALLALLGLSVHAEHNDHAPPPAHVELLDLGRRRRARR